MPFRGLVVLWLLHRLGGFGFEPQLSLILSSLFQLARLRTVTGGGLTRGTRKDKYRKYPSGMRTQTVQQFRHTYTGTTLWDAFDAV